MKPISRSHALSRLAIATLMMLLVGVAVVARPAAAAPDDDFFIWAKWRLGHAPYTCQAGAPWVRPNVRPVVPPSWWKRLAAYEPAPCPQTDEPTVEPTDELAARIVLDTREDALRAAVNAERGRHGLAPLGINASLQRAARGHTADISRFRYFGHDWHDGTPFGTWVTRYTKCAAAGEILAWRSPQETAGYAVRQWLGSPPHRAALLSGKWTVMGVELTPRYATVEFGRRC